MFPLTRVSFWYRFFEPQPNGNQRDTNHFRGPLTGASCRHLTLDTTGPQALTEGSVLDVGFPVGFPISLRDKLILDEKVVGNESS